MVSEGSIGHDLCITDKVKTSPTTATRPRAFARAIDGESTTQSPPKTIRRDRQRRINDLLGEAVNRSAYTSPQTRFQYPSEFAWHDARERDTHVVYSARAASSEPSQLHRAKPERARADYKRLVECHVPVAAFPTRHGEAQTARQPRRGGRAVQATARKAASMAVSTTLFQAEFSHSPAPRGQNLQRSEGAPDSAKERAADACTRRKSATAGHAVRPLGGRKTDGAASTSVGSTLRSCTPAAIAQNAALKQRRNGAFKKLDRRKRELIGDSMELLELQGAARHHGGRVRTTDVAIAQNRQDAGPRPTPPPSNTPRQQRPQQRTLVLDSSHTTVSPRTQKHTTLVNHQKTKRRPAQLFANSVRSLSSRGSPDQQQSGFGLRDVYAGLRACSPRVRSNRTARTDRAATPRDDTDLIILNRNARRTAAGKQAMADKEAAALEAQLSFGDMTSWSDSVSSIIADIVGDFE